MRGKSTGNSRPVYSTDSGRLCPGCGAAKERCTCRSQAGTSGAGGDGIVRLRRQSKGRGGKTVTIIDGLPGSADELRKHAKVLKRHCGVGGAVKEGSIEIQGDQRERLAALLEKDGFRVKLAGG